MPNAQTPQRRTIRRYSFWVAVLLWPAVLVTQALEWTIRSDWPSNHLFAAADQVLLAKLTKDHADIHAFLINASDKLPPILSAAEQAHLQDVQTLLTYNRSAAFVLLGLLIVTLLLSRKGAEACLYGAYSVFGCALGLVIIASRWPLFLRGIHPFFFPHGNWDFNRNTDLITQLYTPYYLAGYGLAIMLTLLILGIALALLGKSYTRVSQKESLVHPKPNLVWMGILLLSAPWMFWSGQQMIQVGTWHWWLYGGLCLAVLTSCVWIAISPHKAAPLAILLCTATLYHCFAFGVRDTVVSCNQFVDQTGNQIVLATKLYALQNQHLPTHLAQLSPQYLPTLATPPTHTPWHYRIRTDQNHFGLEFLGPLNFTYSYSSRSDRWNTLTPP